MSERLTPRDIAERTGILAAIERDAYIIATGADLERLFPYLYRLEVSVYTDGKGTVRARLKKAGAVALESGRAHLRACGVPYP